ncbi:DNA-binding protein [Lizonia empirigonia]|nr:DNA-binding protein [Lizonia empirigonia]
MASATFIETLDAFNIFLTVYIHTLLYLRSLYPRTSFVHSRFHNTSAYQSRHPLVCDWMRDAVDAVRTKLLDGTVSRIVIVIFNYERSSYLPSITLAIGQHCYLDGSIYAACIQRDTLRAVNSNLCARLSRPC